MSVAAGAKLPAVILVHGVAMSSRYMVMLGERLAPYFRVFAPDLPGFGLSERPPKPLNVSQFADALLGWMDRMDVPSTSLLGHSFGAQIVVDVAARYPGRVDKLILVGPTLDSRARALPRLATRWLRCIPREPPALMATVVRDLRDCGLLQALSCLRCMLGDCLEEKLPYVEAPLLAIRGERDALTSQDWIETIAARAQNGYYLTLPGAVHAANFDAADRLARVVCGFVADASMAHLLQETA
jgi:pimeloyl-ACP methyl ester carboxylesterase